MRATSGKAVAENGQAKESDKQSNRSRRKDRRFKNPQMENPNARMPQVPPSDTQRKASSFSLCCCCGSNKKDAVTSSQDHNTTPEQKTMSNNERPNNGGNGKSSQTINININHGEKPPAIETNSLYPNPIHSVRISPCDLVTPRLQSRMIS